MRNLNLYIFILSSVLLLSCNTSSNWNEAGEAVLKDLIVSNAAWAMEQEPETVTAYLCDRSAGGIHDFYSEGDYWWPNPEGEDKPYIRRDGETNPNNFVAHRHSMIRFSQIVGSLATAYVTTGDEKFVEHAFKHINAWFVNADTKMNPNLQYAQAIKGITTGRGIGIIDTIHFMEVAQGILMMQHADNVDKEVLAKAKDWFKQYIVWLRTHPNGLDEMNTKNNHATCWAMQVASFAKLVEDKETLDFCRERYKNILLPNQMADNGSFPLELERTKPYGYALFNLDAMVTLVQILSTEDDNLWEYKTEKGLSIRDGIQFMYPFIKDKGTWTYAKDVMYWDEWPVAQPALYFGAVAYNESSYFDLWKSLKHTSQVDEVIRNLPIRNVLLWTK